MNNYVITCEGLSKAYGREQVLRDLTLDLPGGCVYGLLGRNGHGKTTLLKCLVGLLKPQSGKVATLGQDPQFFSNEIKAKIGYVPQQDSLYPWLKAGEFLRYVASFYPNWNSAMIETLTKEWDVKMNQYLGNLSEGEKQKVSLLSAIGQEPELLVLDEPVSSLDPFMRRGFIKTIVDLFENKKCTVLLSTHITSDLERIADHVGILHNGRIIYSGGIDELKEKHQEGLEDIFVEMTK